MTEPVRWRLNTSSMILLKHEGHEEIEEHEEHEEHEEGYEGHCCDHRCDGRDLRCPDPSASARRWSRDAPGDQPLGRTHADPRDAVLTRAGRSDGYGELRAG